MSSNLSDSAGRFSAPETAHFSPLIRPFSRVVNRAGRSHKCSFLELFRSFLIEKRTLTVPRKVSVVQGSPSLSCYPLEERARIRCRSLRRRLLSRVSSISSHYSLAPRLTVRHSVTFAFVDFFPTRSFRVQSSRNASGTFPTLLRTGLVRMACLASKLRAAKKVMNAKVTKYRTAAKAASNQPYW